MRVLHKHKDTVQLLIENPEDLWYMHSLLDKGDIIKGRTVRKIVHGEHATRKQVFLAISVERTEFSATTLRVLGTITEGPEDVARGDHHAFMIEPGQKITLTKKWGSYHWQRLKEATEQKPVKILAVIFDRDACLFAIVKQQGFEILGTFEGEVEKKQFDQKVRGKFFKEIVKRIDAYEQRNNFDHIILASPSFWKSELFQEVTHSWKEKTVTTTVASANEAGLREALKSEETKKALHLASMAREIRLVEHLLSMIATSEKVAYGLKDVQRCASATETLLVSNAFVEKMRESNTMADLENILKIVESVKGKIFFISNTHEAGKKLDGLGGIAACLRYVVT